MQSFFHVVLLWAQLLLVLDAERDGISTAHRPHRRNSQRGPEGDVGEAQVQQIEAEETAESKEVVSSLKALTQKLHDAEEAAKTAGEAATSWRADSGEKLMSYKDQLRVAAKEVAKSLKSAHEYVEQQVRGLPDQSVDAIIDSASGREDERDSEERDIGEKPKDKDQQRLASEEHDTSEATGRLETKPGDGDSRLGGNTALGGSVDGSGKGKLRDTEATELQAESSRREGSENPRETTGSELGVRDSTEVDALQEAQDRPEEDRLMQQSSVGGGPRLEIDGTGTGGTGNELFQLEDNIYKSPRRERELLSSAGHRDRFHDRMPPYYAPSFDEEQPNHDTDRARGRRTGGFPEQERPYHHAKFPSSMYDEDLPRIDAHRHPRTDEPPQRRQSGPVSRRQDELPSFLEGRDYRGDWRSQDHEHARYVDHEETLPPRRPRHSDEYDMSLAERRSSFPSREHHAGRDYGGSVAHAVDEHGRLHRHPHMHPMREFVNRPVDHYDSRPTVNRDSMLEEYTELDAAQRYDGGHSQRTVPEFRPRFNDDS